MPPIDLVRDDGPLVRLSVGCAGGSDDDRLTKVVTADGAMVQLHTITQVAGGITFAGLSSQAGAMMRDVIEPVVATKDADHGKACRYPQFRSPYRRSTVNAVSEIVTNPEKQPMSAMGALA